MAKRKKASAQPFGVKVAGVAVISLIIGSVLYYQTVNFMYQSKYFKIKAVELESSLSFIRKKDLEKIKGKSIFSIDIAKIQKKLSYKYPQVSQLSVKRQFPDTIILEAKERMPFAQLMVKAKTLILDDYGVVLSSISRQNDMLPRIEGFSVNSSYKLGMPLRGKDVHVALRVLRKFQENNLFSTYRVSLINVENLSQINLQLSNQLNIIVDQDRISEKIEMLGHLLSRGKIDIKETKYIDLRFKEPILGKK